jgi:phosphoadenosine phosphosulfate reductase
MSRPIRQKKTKTMATKVNPPPLRILHPPEETPQPEGALAGDTPLEPTAELMDELAHHSRRLEGATPEEILEWATQRFAPKLTMATAFGPEGCIILHMLSNIAPETYTFNLETGYQFRETLELRDRLAARYGMQVDLRRPETTVEQYEAANGGPVYKTDPSRCCFDRKVTVLKQAIRGWHAWMSAIRRDQSPDRAEAPIVGWDDKFQLVKINPLVNCTKADIWKMITDNDIPYNPLHDQGYTSIGCSPCTRAVLFGEDERAGRWSGSEKTECGLHSLDSPTTPS